MSDSAPAEPIPAEKLEELLQTARLRHDRQYAAAGMAALQEIIESFVPAIYDAAYRATRMVGRTNADLVQEVASHLRLKVIELVDKGPKVRNFRHTVMAWTLRQQAAAHVRQELSPVSIGKTFHVSLAKRQAAGLADTAADNPQRVPLDVDGDDGTALERELVVDADSESAGRIDREAMIKRLPPRLQYLTEVYIGRHGADLAGSSIAIAQHLEKRTGKPITGANVRLWFGQIRELVRRVEEGLRGPQTHENSRTTDWDRKLEPLLLTQVTHAQ